MTYDVRPYQGRYPGDLFVAIARDLLGAIGHLDAVGGDLVEARLGKLPPLLLVRHPDLVREVLIDHNEAVTKARGLRLAQTVLGKGLLTSEPPVHTRQRRLILPAFHHQRLRAYGEVMVEAAGTEAARWVPGRAFDLGESMNRLALVIAGRTLFSADILSSADQVSQAVREALGGFDQAQFPFAEHMTSLPLPANVRTKRARAVLDETVYGLIAERRRAPASGDDLLGMLLDAQDEETGAGMTDEEVRDEAMTLLLAGHETTALALMWTWSLLSDHSEVAAKLHAEVDALGRPPTFDDLGHLRVTRRVFAEAMRLRPPAWVVGRQAAQRFRLGDHDVPAGATLLFAPFFMHRDARFWDAPETVDIDRFLPEAKSERHKFAYLPFSAGRRGCIGEQFAWAEGVIVLAAIAQNWHVSRVGPVPGLHGSVTLRPTGSVVARAIER